MRRWLFTDSYSPWDAAWLAGTVAWVVPGRSLIACLVVLTAAFVVGRMLKEI
jgi:hypothetical protein